MTKLKLGVLSALVIAGAAILMAVRHQLQARLHERDKALSQQADRITQLEAENERLSNLVAQVNKTAVPPGDQARELLRLRGEVGVLRQQTNELGRVRQENRRLSQAVDESETNQVFVEDQLIVRQTHAVDAITTLLQAIKNYATNHDGQYPGNLEQLTTAGDLAATNLAGNLGPSDFEFGQGAGVDPQGNKAILRLRVPIPKPGGGAVMVVGGISDDGVPHTSVCNVSP